MCIYLRKTRETKASPGRIKRQRIYLLLQKLIRVSKRYTTTAKFRKRKVGASLNKTPARVRSYILVTEGSFRASSINKAFSIMCSVAKARPPYLVDILERRRKNYASISSVITSSPGRKKAPSIYNIL